MGRIAIGGADADMHIGPGGDIDAAKHRVLDGSPVAELVRAFHPQELFHGGRDGLGMMAQVAHGVGMPDQKIDGIADEVRRRLVPGIEQKDAVVDQLRCESCSLSGVRRGKGAGADQRR